jgi:predicted dithiol-disulfide oxidoreductase (DUF899 family)
MSSHVTTDEAAAAHRVRTPAAARTGTPAEWRAAQLDLLAREKELNRLRDELAAKRRRLPRLRPDKQYEFDGPEIDAPRGLSTSGAPGAY